MSDKKRLIVTATIVTVALALHWLLYSMPSARDSYPKGLAASRSEQLEARLMFYDVLSAVLHEAWLDTPDAANPLVETQGEDANCVLVTAWDVEVDGEPLEVWQCWRKPKPTPVGDCDDCVVVTFDGPWRPEGAGYWEFRFKDADLGVFSFE